MLCVWRLRADRMRNQENRQTVSFLEPKKVQMMSRYNQRGWQMITNCSLLFAECGYMFNQSLFTGLQHQSINKKKAPKGRQLLKRRPTNEYFLLDEWAAHPSDLLNIDELLLWELSAFCDLFVQVGKHLVLSCLSYFSVARWCKVVEVHLTFY